MKCPKCNEKLVDIIYGMPTHETFKRVEKKELFLGGCEVFIGLEQPKYHCYNCNKNFYKDLVNYEDTTDDDTVEVELPSFLTNETLEQIKGKSLEEIIGFDPFEINENDLKNIDEEIRKTEEYIKRLESNGIYTDWQKEDLKFNKNLLKELKELKENKK